MKGGTTFHFVTDGIHAAMQRAKDAAKDKDVLIGGGVATIQQYLRARLTDELDLAFRPILMGSGENLFAGVDLAEFGYRCIPHSLASGLGPSSRMLSPTDLTSPRRKYRLWKPLLRKTTAGARVVISKRPCESVLRMPEREPVWSILTSPRGVPEASVTTPDNATEAGSIRTACPSESVSHAHQNMA